MSFSIPLLPKVSMITFNSLAFKELKWVMKLLPKHAGTCHQEKKQNDANFELKSARVSREVSSP